jgi:predicted enzyme related to lactoylglutathione lyase
VTPSGVPVWLELCSTDVDRSLAFYAGLFGWSHPVAETAGGVTPIRLGRALVAGAVASEFDGWLTYLSAPDGAEAGVVVDPSGARVGLATDASHPRFGARSVPGAPAWFELHTIDFAAAVPFYRERFGWTPVSLGDSDTFRMVVNGDPATATAGIYDAVRDDLDDESAWMPYFAVEDADLAAARVRELGGALLDQPVDTPFGRIAHATDPLGTLFTIIRLPDPRPAERT